MNPLVNHTLAYLRGLPKPLMFAEVSYIFISLSFICYKLLQWIDAQINPFAGFALGIVWGMLNVNYWYVVISVWKNLTAKQKRGSVIKYLLYFVFTILGSNWLIQAIRQFYFFQNH